MTKATQTIIVDTREQAPLPLGALAEQLGLPFTVERGTLPTGDYTIRGLEDLVLVERKSLGDLVGCVGHDRPRFERELERLAAACRWPVLLVETSARAILDRDYRGTLTPAHVLGSLGAWSLDHRLRVLLAGDRAGATHLLLRLFGATVRRHARGNALPSAAEFRGMHS